MVLYRRIGQWSEEGLSLDESLIQWRASGLPDGARPTSRCSEPCAAGQVKITQSSLEHCCWICQACRAHQIVANESTCLDCERGWWPIENKTTCFELPLTYIHWTSYLAVLPISLAVLGIALTLFVMITFVRHKDTPIVKASGWCFTSCFAFSSFRNLSHSFCSTKSKQVVNCLSSCFSA